MKTAVVCLSILLLLVICIASFAGTIIFKLKEQNEQLLCLNEALTIRIAEYRGFPSENVTTLRYFSSEGEGKPVVVNGYWVGDINARIFFDDDYSSVGVFDNKADAEKWMFNNANRGLIVKGVYLHIDNNKGSDSKSFDNIKDAIKWLVEYN